MFEDKKIHFIKKKKNKEKHILKNIPFNRGLLT